MTDLEHINKLKLLKPGDTLPEEEKGVVAMSMSEEERGLSMKQRKQQKMQRLRDKVRIRLDMIEHEFKELQQEIDYEQRERQNKPLVDPETGLLLDERFYDESGSPQDAPDSGDEDEDTLVKNLLAQNELLMLTSSDTDALLAAYAMDGRAGRKQSTSDLDSRQRRVMLKVLNVSRKGVSSKEARLQRAGEDEKVRTYEQLNKKTHH